MKNRIIFLSLVIGILFIGCKSNPTFEKDGGIRVKLSVSYQEYIKSLVVNENDSQFNRVLSEINNEQVKDFNGYVNAFQKATEKLLPETTLAAIFSRFEWKDKINYNSSNEEVVRVLKTEWDSVLISTINTIKKRLEKMDAENAIVKIENGNNIIVEIPGNKDLKRIEKVLLTVGKLGFWETYQNQEMYAYLTQINDYLVKIKYFQSNEAITPITEKQSSDSSSLISLVEDQKELNNQSVDSLAATLPLFSVLMPVTSGDGKLIPGSAVGNVLSKDTAIVNRILQLDTVLQFLPRNCRLVWSNAMNQGENNYFELVALKCNRGNQPVLDGSVIATVEAKQNEISLQMNAEGTKIWKRMTAENINRQIAVTLDDIAYTHPTVMSQIEGGKSTITGNFTNDEATDLAFILNAGKYPIKLNLVKTEAIEAKK